MKYLESKVNCFDTLDLYFFPIFRIQIAELVSLQLISVPLGISLLISIHYTFILFPCTIASFVVGFHCNHLRRNTQILNYYR